MLKPEGNQKGESSHKDSNPPQAPGAKKADPPPTRKRLKPLVIGIGCVLVVLIVLVAIRNHSQAAAKKAAAAKAPPMIADQLSAEPEPSSVTISTSERSTDRSMTITSLPSMPEEGEKDDDRNRNAE